MVSSVLGIFLHVVLELYQHVCVYFESFERLDGYDICKKLVYVKIAIITARIILHLISYPQFTYDLFSYAPFTYISFTGTYEPKIDLLPTSVAS